MYTFFGEELEVHGLIGVELSVGENKVNSHVIVAKSGTCQLGHVKSKELGLLPIGLNAGSIVVQLGEEPRRII